MKTTTAMEKLSRCKKIVRSTMHTFHEQNTKEVKAAAPLPAEAKTTTTTATTFFCSLSIIITIMLKITTDTGQTTLYHLHDKYVATTYCSSPRLTHSFTRIHRRTHNTTSSRDKLRMQCVMLCACMCLSLCVCVL